MDWFTNRKPPFDNLMPAAMGTGRARAAVLRYELERYYAWMRHISPIQTRFPQPIDFLTGKE